MYFVDGLRHRIFKIKTNSVTKINCLVTNITHAAEN